MSEVTAKNILDAMAPAHPHNSRYAYQILDAFSKTTLEQGSGPNGQRLLECADTLGAMAVTMGYTIDTPPSIDGQLDQAATHVMGHHPQPRNIFG